MKIVSHGLVGNKKVVITWKDGSFETNDEAAITPELRALITSVLTDLQSDRTADKFLVAIHKVFDEIYDERLSVQIDFEE